MMNNMNRARSQARLPPEVNRLVYVKNLPFKISPSEMYDVFGKFGPIRQIRIGSAKETRGKAFVVYEDIYDAKNAVDHLSGFNIGGRYIIVLYHNSSLPGQGPNSGGAGITKGKAVDVASKRAELERLKAKYGVDASTPSRKI